MKRAEDCVFREGTILARELVTLYDDADALPDGSTRQVNGRGYFVGEFAGFEVAYRSATRFPTSRATERTSASAVTPLRTSRRRARCSVEDCSVCHQDSPADVFTRFYPDLRASRDRSESIVRVAVPGPETGSAD